MAGHIASSSSVDWNTPEQLVERIRTFFGGKIDLDPCSNSGSIVKAVLEYLLPEKDAFVDPWFQEGVRTCYVNPPFGVYFMKNDTSKDILLPKELKAACEILCTDPKKPTPAEKKTIRELRAQYTRFTLKDWAKRITEEYRKGLETIVLIPAQPGTGAWQEYIHPNKRAICNLAGRLRFIGAEAGAPMDCVLIYFGDRPEEFRSAFEELGHVDIFGCEQCATRGVC